MASSTTGLEERTRKSRAAKACQRCNQRRIKCDALQRGTPCTRCRDTPEAQCTLIKSRRGLKARQRARVDSHTEERDTIVASPDRTTSQDQVAADSRDPTTIVTDPQAESDQQSHPDHPKEVDQLPDPTRTGDMDNALIATSSRDESSELVTSRSPDNAEDGQDEVSWSAMFDHFLESRTHDRRDVIDKCAITYLGESFPLALVLKDMLVDGSPQLHHPGPRDDEPNSRPTRISPEDLQFLEAKKAFQYPDKKIMNALVAVFIERYFPLYPVVNLQEFLAQHEQRTIPWLLLHSICFAVAAYCPMPILYQADFNDRKEARTTYYSRAKALFSVGYESNKIVVLQSTIMLSFWGGNPNDYWNFYSWISAGVTVAETLGIHRSLTSASMRQHDKSLLKRLWWVLVVRDAHCGALIGRPLRISLDHADIDMLAVEDFECELSCERLAHHPLRDLFGVYQVQMAKLSLVLRQIVATRFCPEDKLQPIAHMEAMLRDWRERLPCRLNWSDYDTDQNILASCLAIMFNHLIIFNHLGQTRHASNNGVSGVGISSVPEVLETAAHSILSIASSLVTKSRVLTMSHETFHGLFMAEVVFYAQVKSPQPMIARSGRLALNNCQMILHEAIEAWDAAKWVMQLFENLINNLKANECVSESTTAMDPYESSLPPIPDLADDMFMNTDEMAFPSGNYAFQSNPMLSSFLDAWTGADFSAHSDTTGMGAGSGSINIPHMS